MTHLKNKSDRIATRARRPTIYSSDDVERMAVESSRARFIMHLLRKPEESASESGPCLRGSETARTPVVKQNFLTYPTLVPGLRWSPSIETYSGDSQAETAESLGLHCDCHKCQINRIRARNRQSKFLDAYSFKENIIRFCDTSTMTRNLKDSGCGVRTPLSSMAGINTSDVSISTSDATKVLKILTPQTYSPAPILKKTEFGKEINHRAPNKLGDSTGRKRSDYEDLLNTYTKEPVTIIPFNKNGRREVRNSRKVLYNEGISNLIANTTNLPKFPVRSKQIKSQVKLESSNRVNVSIKRFGGKNTVIPYTHRTNSKYHYDCKEPNRSSKVHVVQDLTIVPASPPPAKKSARSDRANYIKLPKRVLTSE